MRGVLASPHSTSLQESTALLHYDFVGNTFPFCPLTTTGHLIISTDQFWHVLNCINISYDIAFSLSYGYQLLNHILNAGLPYFMLLIHISYSCTLSFSLHFSISVVNIWPENFHCFSRCCINGISFSSTDIQSVISLSILILLAVTDYTNVFVTMILQRDIVCANS